ncbi:ATP-binding cassette domain-containing protein [Rhodobacteraceae bacterium]|nr:ATP-binding cassette domain-containing protein [Paracoccaceae bacterium]
MIKIEKISFSIGGRKLLDTGNINIPSGHKVGVVGRNGTGKTTLFGLIKEDLELESGQINIPKNAKIGDVQQEVSENNLSVIDTILAADEERETLLKRAETEKDPDQIAEMQIRLDDIGAWSAEARASTILKGLGFNEEDNHLPCQSFSGGWRMRISLAAVLFNQPDLLLLDEPTNYLDLEGTIWLENYLGTYPHTVLVISHDRNLLNNCVNSILHLEDKNLTYYSGNYEKFAETRMAQLENKFSEIKKQDKTRQHLQSFVDRFRYKAKKAKQAQSRLKALSKLKTISLPNERALRKILFPSPDKLASPLLSIENGSTGYNGKAVLSNLNLRIDHDEKIALLGKNGEGKSTLSKLLADRIPLLSGSIIRSSKLRIGYFSQHQTDELRKDETPFDHLSRVRPNKSISERKKILGSFGIGSDQSELQVLAMSGGQKARLLLLLATLDNPHLLILDEPTNHLDIESREALIEALTKFSGAVILVSHDFHLLSLVSEKLWLVKNGVVCPYEEDLESYRSDILLKKHGKRSKASKNSDSKKENQKRLLAHKAEVNKCEDRVEKLLEMRKKVADILSDQDLYSIEKLKDLENWNKKFSEIDEAIIRAEKLWLQAQQNFEKIKLSANK